jgi:hypothetical protein
VSSAIYAVREDENLDYDMDGTALCASIELLDSLADQLGVVPLMSLVSASEEDRELIAEAGGDLEEEVWFEPSDGLEAVRAFMAALESGSVVGVAEGVEQDLADLEALLVDADEAETRFHLAIDY